MKKPRHPTESSADPNPLELPNAGELAEPPTPTPPLSAHDRPADEPDDESHEGPRPTHGRIVHYTLADDDLQRIMPLFDGDDDVSSKAGDSVPALVVAASGYRVVLRAFPVSETNSLLVRNVKQGTGPGQWHWPGRVE
jgi:hypothetical protein